MHTWDAERRQRCEILAEYITDHHTTIRQAAREYGISKSTVHKDLTEKLPHVNRELYATVKVLLDQNKAERHLRGGEATKRKYRLQKEAMRKEKE